MTLRQRTTSETDTVSLRDLMMFSFTPSCDSEFNESSFSKFTDASEIDQMSNTLCYEWFKLPALLNKYRFNLPNNTNLSHFINRYKKNKKKDVLVNSNQDNVLKPESARSITYDDSSKGASLIKTKTDVENKKEGSRCCCITGVKDDNETTPIIADKVSNKSLEDLNNFVSRYEKIILNAILETTHLQDQNGTMPGDELFDVVGEHLKTLEKQLSSIHEFMANPTSYFDYVLNNPTLETNCSGDIDSKVDKFDEFKTKFKINMSSISKIEKDGGLKIRGFGTIESPTGQASESMKMGDQDSL